MPGHSAETPEHTSATSHAPLAARHTVALVRNSSHFGYAGPLTETVLLGTVAHRAGKKIQWDAENMKVTNCPKANEHIRREYRHGWSL